MAERKPQPPIGNKLIGKVTKAIDNIEAKQLALARQPFTTGELLQLFVDPVHHEVLTRAYSICEPSGHAQFLYVFLPLGPEYGAISAHLCFHWNGIDNPNAFYVPYRDGSHRDYPAAIRDEAPTALVEKFRQVAADLVDVHYRFAQVRRVLTALNKNAVCPSLAALRYHWPCIVPLLRLAHLTDEAEWVEEPNARAGGSASIYPDLRKRLAPTNQTIASHFLIEDAPNPPASPVAYELHHSFR